MGADYSRLTPRSLFAVGVKMLKQQTQTPSHQDEYNSDSSAEREYFESENGDEECHLSLVLSRESHLPMMEIVVVVKIYPFYLHNHREQPILAYLLIIPLPLLLHFLVHLMKICKITEGAIERHEFFPQVHQYLVLPPINHL
jgi:hypothetical protein